MLSPVAETRCGKQKQPRTSGKRGPSCAKPRPRRHLLPVAGFGIWGEVLKTQEFQKLLGYFLVHVQDALAQIERSASPAIPTARCKVKGPRASTATKTYHREAQEVWEEAGLMLRNRRWVPSRHLHWDPRQ